METGDKEIVKESFEHTGSGESFWGYVKRQFNKNRLAVVSLYFVFFLAFLAVFADFLANEKPIVAKYQGEWGFPVFKQYAVDFGVTTWDEEFRNVKWSEVEFDFAIWPPIPYLPQNLDLMNSRVGPFDDQRVESLYRRHWLGADDLGRDIFSAMIHATRIALSVGIVSMSIAALIGILLGSLAGYFGDDRLRMSRGRLLINLLFLGLAFYYAFGMRSFILGDAIGETMGNFLLEFSISILIFISIMALANLIAKFLKRVPWFMQQIAVPVDMVISRLIEVIVTIPALFLIVAIVAIAKPSVFLVMAVIGFTSWTGIARFIRAELLKIRNLEYIEAAHSLGFSEFRTLFRHAIPNALSPVLIAIAFGIASAILIESILSFMGLGVPADTITWGSLLSASRKFSQDWWLAIFPGFAIFLTVTVFNLIGEGLTDALDPRQKK